MIGATVNNVIVLLSVDFFKLILVAILVAFPLAWYITSQWLHSFAYRIDIGPGIFITAGASIITITLITISYQAIKAAIVNPVKSLKSE